jgi:hypothetical protein
VESSERLQRLVADSDWMMHALRAVRSIDLPDWAIGSGAIRNLVWDDLHGYADPTPVNDVDVAFFDPRDVSRERDEAIESRLTEVAPDVPWEVTNQAGVHLWYEEKFGYPIRPLNSTEDALAHWPETATSVGVRLLADDSLQVIAPVGLDDLFGLVLRRNPKQVTREFFRERVVSKRIRERWPKVVVLDD